MQRDRFQAGVPNPQAISLIWLSEKDPKHCRQIHVNGADKVHCRSSVQKKKKRKKENEKTW